MEWKYFRYIYFIEEINIWLLLNKNNKKKNNFQTENFLFK